MRPIELEKLLSFTIPAKMPILVKGAPGIGKTAVIEKATEDFECDLLVMHPVVSDPTDFKGLPAIVDGHAMFLPFGELNVLINAERPTLAFLDDLGQAPAQVQAAAMHLLLARSINGKKISKHICFAAATNRREDRAGVTGILEPVKSRFTTIVELQPNLEDWIAWALEAGLSTEIVAFLRWKPDVFNNPGKVTGDIVNRPSPRTIANFARLYKLMGVSSAESLAGCAGEGMATEFIGFIKVIKDLPTMEEIFKSPLKASIPSQKNPAALYAVATAVAAYAKASTTDEAITYLDRLPDEFSVLGVRDLTHRIPEVNSSKRIAAWYKKHENILI